MVIHEPHIAQLHQPYAAVLVPDGEGAAPAAAGLHDPGEPSDHQIPVLLVYEQGRRVPPERFLGGVAVQVLGLWAPQHDPPIGVQQDGGHTEEVHQPARLWRHSLRLAGLRRTPVGCAHPGTPSTRRTTWAAPRSRLPLAQVRGLSTSRWLWPSPSLVSASASIVHQECPAAHPVLEGHGRPVLSEPGRRRPKGTPQDV